MVFLSDLNGFLSIEIDYLSVLCDAADMEKTPFVGAANEIHYGKPSLKNDNV